MSEEDKEETKNSEVGAESPKEETKPSKKLTFITKFFLFAFTVLLIFHFVTNWISTEKVSTQNTEISDLNKDISSLKLTNQELSAKVKNLGKLLQKAETNLEFVDLDRVKKANEIQELTAILSTLQKNIPEGSKLVIQRLEKKLQAWEEYYKSLNEVLEKRPVK